MNPDKILEKLERKRAYGRARAKKHYEAHKENVLGKQKKARENFTEEVKKAFISKGIPLIKQPTEPIRKIQAIQQIQETQPI